MPEYPEVWTVCKYLRQNIVGQNITYLEIFHDRLLRGEFTLKVINDLIKEERITEIVQRGKYIIIQLTTKFIVSHLRMEGKYYFCPRSGRELQIPKRHIGFIMHFKSGASLWFHDKRRFGTLHYANNELKLKEIITIGPSPFNSSLTGEYLYELVKKRKRMIKPFLLDQKNIAGIGNIYADEVLFQCGLHPSTPVNQLSSMDWDQLLAFTRKIFSHAIELGGTTIFTFHNNFVNGKFKNELFVYGRVGKQCRKCLDPIHKIKLGQRGTSFCANCQLEPTNIIRPVVYVLTGRICSGKTTLMHILENRIQAKLIFSDQIINNLYSPGMVGHKFVNYKYPQCIINKKVSKQALFQLIRQDHKILDIIEQHLESSFYMSLNSEIKKLIHDGYKQENGPIIIEIPFINSACEWIRTARYIRSRILYLQVNQEIQSNRLQERNHVDFITAKEICTIFNHRESDRSVLSHIIISNNTKNVDQTANEIIAKINLKSLDRE